MLTELEIACVNGAFMVFGMEGEPVEVKRFLLHMLELHDHEGASVWLTPSGAPSLRDAQVYEWLRQ